MLSHKTNTRPNSSSRKASITVNKGSILIRDKDSTGKVKVNMDSRDSMDRDRAKRRKRGSVAGSVSDSVIIVICSLFSILTMAISRM
jgi:hypothetical protein